MHQQIKNQMREALKNKDTVRLRVLRGLLSSFTNELVARKKTPQGELSDEEVLDVITREAKKRKDSVEQFRAGNREDLAEQEAEELQILETYLPEMMSKEDIKPLALKKKEELGIEDKSQMGILMGALMKDLKGQADGGDVKDVVNDIL